ncbi:MAG TPA: pilus assembly protein PilP [Pseudomonadales bacterium]|nr:pilus assembly protein PilP [Pseudomonadales bacterium]
MSRKIWIFCCFMLSSSLAMAANQPTSTPGNTADDVQDEAVPEAMRHAVKGPDIDFKNLRDPFKSYLSTVAERGQQLLRERLSSISNRKREELENFDLGTLKLVAIYKIGEKRVAMIQDSSGKGYVVKRGNYMGKNNGRIEKIDNENVYLVEQVLNPAGEVTDRQVTLTLKEVNQ